MKPSKKWTPIWLVVSNMDLIFHLIYRIIHPSHWRTHIFSEGLLHHQPAMIFPWSSRCASAPGPSAGLRPTAGPRPRSAAQSGCTRSWADECGCWWWSGSFGPCGPWRCTVPVGDHVFGWNPGKSYWMLCGYYHDSYGMIFDIYIYNYIHIYIYYNPI